MPVTGAHASPDPYGQQVRRRLETRAPLGFAVFLFCVAISTLFEMLRFPERRAWMGTFASGFVFLVAVAWTLLRRRPAWSVVVLVAFVNVVGAALNAYHALVGASIAMCVWTLTGLLCSSALILPWGWRNQLLASAGALLSYPVHLEVGTIDPLAWGAGGAYLLVAAALSACGAALFDRYLQTDLRLSAALSEREARLQSYFDLSLVGTAILAPDGVCREVNDELCGMLGYSPAELSGLVWPALLHPDERATGSALFARALAGDGARADLRCARRDGATLHASVAMRGLPGPGDRIDHVMVLVHDITERKRTETERERYLVRAEAARREAEDASRAKDAFLAAVSHELRTPLTPILAWSGLLRKGELGAEKTGQALAAIERSVKTQVQLIDDLLDVSRIVSGEWRLAPKPVDLAPIIRMAVDVMQAAADAKGVALHAAVPSRAVWMRGDPDRMQQVVTNLLSNAVKFTPAGGRVDVALECDGARACLVVRDTGEGIPSDFLPHVFEPFRQADGSRTRRHGGLGLGLAIVQALVEQHGGTVRAQSAGPDRGAVFTVELPLLIEGASVTTAAARGREASGAELAGLHVLVVDDDPDSNAAVSTVLTSCGAEVRTALSTPDALEIVGRWPPDVLVSDIAMPGEDGHALLRTLRARGDRVGRVPAVALTAYAGAADRQRSLAAGFLAHVVKPFDVAELASAVEKAAQEARRPAGRSL